MLLIYFALYPMLITTRFFVSPYISVFTYMYYVSKYAHMHIGAYVRAYVQALYAYILLILVLCCQTVVWLKHFFCSCYFSADVDHRTSIPFFQQSLCCLSCCTKVLSYKCSPVNCSLYRACLLVSPPNSESQLPCLCSRSRKILIEISCHL